MDAGAARTLTWVVVDPGRALGVAVRIAVTAISVVKGVALAGNVDVTKAAGDSEAGAPGEDAQLVSSKTSRAGRPSGRRTSLL